MALSRPVGWLLALAVCLVQLGCATPGAPPVDALIPGTDRWVGRFSLTRTGEQVATERLTVGFELSGNAREGELVLEGPLGARLARATWADDRPAWLERGNRVESFETMAALTEAVVGQPLPMHALFLWLKGTEASAPPWTADLTQWPNGKLTAWQTVGTETVRIAVVFDAAQPTRQVPVDQ